MYGRKLKDWIPQIGDCSINENEEIRDHDKIYKYKSKARYDSVHGCKDSTLGRNDRVLRNLIPQNKLAPLYSPNPATVIEKQGNSVIVETDDGKRYRRNSSHLKRFSTTEELEQEQQSNELSADWATPPSPTARSSTPIVAAEQICHTNNAGRPKRDTRRPLRFEDYEVDV